MTNKESKQTEQKYITVFTVSFISVFLVVVLVNYKGTFHDTIFGSHTLLNYQIEKVRAVKNIETVFIGDSSLGNMIDAKVFTDETASPSINLALTGSHGYAGSYNMLKRILDNNNNKIRNVVIIQTLDLMKRPISYYGYLMTLDSIEDVKELNAIDIKKLFYAFCSIVLSPARLIGIVKYYFGMVEAKKINYDYIEQGERIRIDKRIKPITLPINKDKPHFLRKIIALCKSNNLNLIYAHGPVWRPIGERSNHYIAIINNVLRETGINLLPIITFIDSKDIGDSEDHVMHDRKVIFTRKYVKYLSPILKH